MERHPNRRNSYITSPTIQGVVAEAKSGAKFELGLVAVGAVLIGGGAVLLRLQLPVLDLPYNLREFQYSLGFLMVGLLLLLGWKAEETAVGKGAVFLSLATLVALGMQPGSNLFNLATNIVFGLSVVLLGIIYFQFSRGRPSTRPLLASLWGVMLVQLLYGAWYLFVSIQRTENLRLGIGMMALLFIFLGFSSMLQREWRQASPTEGGGFHEN
jgi:hypothetical protein